MFRDNICCIKNIDDLKKRLLWEVTSMCNLNCSFCMRTKEYDKDPTLEEIKAAYEKISAYGIDNIIITGGEPLLRKDIFEIFMYFKEKKKSFFMCTNATLIDNYIAKEIAFYTKKISVSLDSHKEETHDKLRGKVGAFNKTILGIECLIKAGIDVNIISLLNNNNIYEMEDIVKFVSEKRVKSISFAGEINDKKYYFEDKGVKKEIFNKLKNLRNQFKELPIYTKSILGTGNNQKCNAGKYVLGIDVNLFLYPCLTMKNKEKSGINLRENNASEKINHFFNFYENKEDNNFNTCPAISRRINREY